VPLYFTAIVSRNKVGQLHTSYDLTIKPKAGNDNKIM